MVKDEVKKKVRKTLLYSALFTIVFSGSAAISYYLTPSKTVGYEPPATSQGGTTSQPGTPGQTDHLSKLLARLESLPGIDGNLEGSVTFPKTSGSGELSTATIDADFILSLADSNDYAFSLDLEAGLNGSTKKISAAYIENELSFDLLGAKFYSDHGSSRGHFRGRNFRPARHRWPSRREWRSLVSPCHVRRHQRRGTARFLFLRYLASPRRRGHFARLSNDRPHLLPDRPLCREPEHRRGRDRP